MIATMTAMPPSPHPAAVGAFFDVDNTLVPGPAIEVRFFRYLFTRRLVGFREAAASAWHLVQHMPPLSLHPLRERKLYLAGKSTVAIESLAGEFIRRDICPRLSPHAVAALDAHRRDGHRIVLLTGSLDFLIAPLAEFLKVETFLAACPERAENRYTGRVLSPLPYGDGKRRLVDELVVRERIDLTSSFAYGDSPGDVALLRAVGHPRVINPIRGMRRIARDHGWPVAQWA